MEKHPKTSVVSGYFADVNQEDMSCELLEFTCSLDKLLNVNCVVNPASMLRKADIERCGIVYEREYIYAEDYRFWSRILMCGLEIRVLPYHFVRYRFSFTQSTSTHRKDVIRSANKVRYEISSYLSRLYYHDYNPPVIVPKGKKLSVLIPFSNEGEEVYNTVNNIKGLVGDKVDIIVCNDQSTDGYDYAKDLKNFKDVYYFYNANRLGVAGTRDYCVSLCQTPYFILLDAHMRFYTDDWVEILVNILEKDDRCVLCCQSKPLTKDGGRVSEVIGCPQSYGAFLPFVSTDLTGIKWRYDEISNGFIEPVPAILGAGYAASKRYWTHIDGLRGLRSYGSDEQYLSLKVWLEGGKCLLVKKVLAGHIYREKSPYVRNRVDEYFNKLLVSEVFFNLSQKCRVLTMLYLQDKDVLANATDLYTENKSEIVSIAERQKSIRTGSLREYARLTRNLCPKECEQDELSEVLLQVVVQKILDENPKMSGISDGKMGYILWLSLYNRLTANGRVSQKISELWQCIKEDIDMRLLPLNFRNGLLGIGWGLYTCKSMVSWMTTLASFLNA